MALLEENGLIIKSLTTDRHTSVSKFIRTEKNYIRHFYDIWHVAKGLKKKLDHISLKQGGELVNSWKKSIINHLYWCAVSTADGNGDLMLAKWQSILNHLVNQHTGHPNLLFPSCLHGSEYSTENIDWFEPGTDDYESVCKILDHCKLEKDIKKLSPIHQTAALESFHSLVIKFAPKHTAFSYLGMRSRLHIAAMHYNENCGEETDDTDEKGNVRCSIIFPKYKKGDYSIKKQKKSPTQG
uniref:Mutator-like transposase domain-containing protein n=1 Tax=Biomphalaria glabrata TaxID=6526 RepID=A0A2C9JZY7_BIOGL